MNFGWSDIAATLVANGHSFFDIQKYSLSQVLVLFKAHRRKTAMDRLSFIVDVRAAVWADGKEYEKHVKDLQEEVK